MWGLREIYVIEFSDGVLLNSYGGVVIYQLNLAVVKQSSEVAVTEFRVLGRHARVARPEETVEEVTAPSGWTA